MKKMIRVLIPIALFLIIAMIGIGTVLYEKYSYSDEMANLDGYFGEIPVGEYLELKKANLNVESDKESLTRFETEVDEIVPITLGVERIEEKVVKIDDYYYLSITDVKKYLNDRFYVDNNEGYLLYATATDVIRADVETKTYIEKGESKEFDCVIATYLAGEYYLSLEYVKKLTNYEYEIFSDPFRIQLETEFTTREHSTVIKDSAIREKGGIKSPIVQDVAAGEDVVILEEMETWIKVMTDDLYIGYIERKHLDNFADIQMEVPTHYMEEEFTRIKKDFKISMGWHQVTVKAANELLTDVLVKSKGINVISPTWYSVSDNEGNFIDISSKAYVDEAHAKGVEVWAALDNFNSGNEIDINNMMSFTSKREYFISNLMSSALETGVDGINLDFELIPEEAGESYVQFMRELSIACRLNNLVFSVDNYVPMPHTDHYNRKEQGVFADYVVIMGYDEHWHNSGEAGSVASIDFVEMGIKKTLEDVPADKIINAIPFYTNIWSTKDGVTTDRQVGMDFAEEAVVNNGATPEWDDSTCQNYVEFSNGDGVNQIWLEDEESISAKLGVMEANNVAGVAHWKLGLEKPEIWEIITNYINN